MWVIAALIVALTGATNGAEWSYDYETQWPGVCTTGKEQSPINIMTRSAITDLLETHIIGPLVFRGYGSVNASVANTGHTVQWTLVEDVPAPVLSGGPLRGNYTLMQFHLHWLSEHAIDGMKYPLEIHMVHIKTGLTVDEAIQRPDGLAVIGILAEVHGATDENEYPLGEIEPRLPYLVTRNEGYVPATIYDLTRFFTSNMQSYYTYHGSLTTPNCQEVVTWIVMDNPITISDTQFKLISKIDVGGINNYRSLQVANRVVYRSKESSASHFLPSTFTILAALLNLSSTVTSVMSNGVCTLVNVKKKFLGDNVEKCSMAKALFNN